MYSSLFVLETEISLPRLQKPAICQCTEHACMSSARNGVFFGFHDCENETWCYHSWYWITDIYKHFWVSRCCNVQLAWSAGISEKIETADDSTICHNTETVIHWNNLLRFHTFISSYVLSNFLPRLVVIIKLKWQYYSQTYRITTLNLSSSTNLVMRLPNNSDMAWDRYVTPFSYGMWLAVATTACALGVCLALTNYGHERNQSLTVSAIFFYIHACFCHQGQTDKSCFTVFVSALL